MRDSNGHTTDSMTTFLPVLGGRIVFFYIFSWVGVAWAEIETRKQGGR